MNTKTENRGGSRIHTPRQISAPTEKATTHDLAWFAGIFEGEGSIWKAKRCHYGQGLKLTVTQKDEWVTTRLRALFGGSLTLQNERINSMTGKPSSFSKWTLSGQRAFILTQTIFHLMSPRRREQFEKAWASRMED